MWCVKCGVVWCGVVSGGAGYGRVVWCAVFGVWCGVRVGVGVVWCRCGVVWCGVVWRGVVRAKVGCVGWGAMRLAPK